MSDQGVSPLLPQPTKRFSVDSGVVSLLPHMEALLQDEADGLMASAECASPPYPPACPAQHMEALLQDECLGGGRSSHTSAQARASVGPGVSSLCALLP